MKSKFKEKFTLDVCIALLEYKARSRRMSVRPIAWAVYSLQSRKNIEVFHSCLTNITAKVIEEKILEGDIDEGGPLDVVLGSPLDATAEKYANLNLINYVSNPAKKWPPTSSWKIYVDSLKQ